MRERYGSVQLRAKLVSVGTMEKAYYFLFVLWLLPLQLCLNFLVADCGSVVKFLPGFQGPLPFEMETGYIGVGEAEEVQLFYYFVKSERNAKEDPLLLWLTGGPGCSTLSAFLYEIGPLAFRVVKYNGSLPTLILNPHSWTKMSSIIFVDMPVGTGFSYATTQLASQSSDSMQVRQADQFLRKWIMDHPEFGSNKFYVGGDSYSGITVPAVAQLISERNEEGIKPRVNLQGYLVGNGVTDPISQGNSQIPFAHGMAIISDELYESLKTSCGGEYQYELIDPTNADCFKHLGDYYQLIVGLNTAQILEPLCAFASPKPVEKEFNRRRSLFVNSTHILDSEDPPLPEFGCRSYGYLLSSYWTEDDKVRKALHIREGTVDQWLRCNYGLQYISDIDNSVKYHAYLSTKGYRSLIYSGDHDMGVPFLGTQEWIRSLNYSIIDEWRPWFVQGQIAGYTRTYANRMTFATIKGGGHTAPEYTPAECDAMYQRWIFEESL